MEKVPNFIIDCSALKDIFEGKNKGKSNELLEKFKSILDNEGNIVAMTPLSSFMRAIYLSDPNVNINKIQKTLSFLHVFPSFADFRNGKAVRKEIIDFAHVMSGGKNE